MNILESPESEAAVLGSIILKNESIRVAKHWLTEDSFYRAEHRLLYSAMLALENEGSDIDLVILRDKLTEMGKLDSMGGVQYLIAVAESVPSACSIEYYAKSVRKYQVRRQLLDVGQKTIAATGNGDDVETQISKARSDLDSIELPQEHVAKISEHLEDALEATESHDTGIKTGLASLDATTGGLKPGNVIIVAGRPSMGKTALGLNLVAHMADHGSNVMVFSLEMTKIAVAQRLIHAHARRGRDGDIAELSRAATEIKEWPLYIVEQSMLTADKMVSIAENYSPKPDVILIDYLQLMWESSCKESRYQQVTLISRKIKAAAMKLNVPIILISQLNRGVEQRTNKRPMMSDLRDSGAIEQDADIILLLYREKYYKPESDIDYAEVTIGKNREGETGFFKLAWHPEYVRFDNMKVNV